MPAPTISAVLCTRDRGDQVTATIESILANTHDQFELLVVDQSADDVTRHAVDPFLVDRRCRYLRRHPRGLSHARNEGLAAARSDLVAFTDDDCTVSSDWLEGFESALEAHPDVAVAFCSVEAGPHDDSAGFVPAYDENREGVMRAPHALARARVMGAGMAVRRDAVLAIGGFDEQLGAGAELMSGEDRDIALRALWRGHGVLETSAVSVVHHGFRTWHEGRALARRDWMGLGATYVKALRQRDWRSLWLVLYEVAVKGVLEPLSGLARGRRPMGLGRTLYFGRGMLAGLRRPLDPGTMAYTPAAVAQA